MTDRDESSTAPPGFALRTEPYTLELRHPFRLSRGASVTRTNLFVELSSGGRTGWGEAAPNARYAQDWRSAERAVERMARDLEHSGWNPQESERRRLDEVADPAEPAARAALDMAAWDLAGQHRGQPVWALLGVRPGDLPKALPQTSYTLGIDDPEALIAKVGEAKGFASLKVKLGGTDDRGAIRAVRSATDQPLRVDANEGWALEDAKEHVRWLADAGVELVEQPLPAADLDGHRALRRVSPIPLFADESVLTAAEIPELVGAFDGINVKLAKCGGIDRALEMIAAARRHDLAVMLGCMIESTLAITAAAHLSPLVDLVDLDGALLVANDPFRGATLEDGSIVPPSEPGLGVVRVPPRA